MDSCGAMSLKTCFKNVTTIYIKREKNAVLCDYVISFDTYDEAVEQLNNILK